MIFSGLCSIQSSNFNQDFTLTWGNDHVNFTNDNQTVQLSLDEKSGIVFIYMEETSSKTLSKFL